MSADPEPGRLPAEAPGERPAETPDSAVYRVDARGADGVLVGEQGTQINYFYQGTWTDGVAPPPLVGVSGTITSPYRGLRAYGERDAGLFFGRESAVSQVLALMSRRLDGAGLLVVSGVSGAGKSSLLAAGVLPRLRGAGLASAPEAASWPCVVFTPTSRPLDELAVRVAPVAGADAASVRQALAADPAGFALTARQAALAHTGGRAPENHRPESAGQRRILLVIDQFEKLFTQCEQESDRQAFITALHEAASAADGHPGPAAVVVLVVRADFEARLADYPVLAPAVQDRYLLTSMTQRQLRLAITQPASAAGSSVDADLVQMLVQEVGPRTVAATDGPGGTAVGAGVLPLLSHALDQAWRSRSGPGLTLADYERTGGIEGAVADSAQRAYDALTPAQQGAARQVFTRLTATTSDGLETTARATPADLTAGRSDDQARDVEVVLETFAAERLLTLAAGSVEISHEIVLTAWPLLRDSWLADTHADRAARTRLHATAGEWSRAARDPAYLYSGSRLETAVHAAARTGADARHTSLSPDEQDFLGASQRAARRRVRIRRAFTATVLALTVGMSVVAAAAIRASDAAHQASDAAHRASRAANQGRDVAVSDLLASKSQALGSADATTSQQESIEAWGLNHSGQARYAMLMAAASPQTATLTSTSITGPAYSVVFSPHTAMMAASDGRTVQMWNVATRQPGPAFSLRLPPGLPGVSGPVPAASPMAFSPDGKVLAVGDDGRLRLWNVATGREIGTFFNGNPSAAQSLAFSPDGRIIAAGGTGTADLWDMATGHEIGHPYLAGNVLPSQGPVAVAFSPDGKTLVTGGPYGRVELWQVTTGPHLSALMATPRPIVSAAFSPDGRTVATGSDQGQVRLWDVATHRQVASTLLAGRESVYSVAFSRDGKTLATANQDSTVRLWDMATSRQLGSTLVGGTGPAYSVAFSPDGRTLATGDEDRTVRLWDVAVVAGRPAAPAIVTGSQSGAPIAFSPAGEMLAIGGFGGIVTLWNFVIREQLGDSFVVNAGAVMSVAFSPDGTTLATGGDNGMVQLWNVNTSQQIGTPINAGMSITTETSVGSVAFSPDGKTLATGDVGGDVRLWDVATHRQIGGRLTTGTGPVLAVGFSPDGKTLATDNFDGSVTVWDLARRSLTSSSTTSNASDVNTAAVSPDGGTLALGDVDGTVRLWDVNTGQQIGKSIVTGTGRVDSLAFSPDGKTLATGGDNGTIQRWDVSYLVDPLARLCARIGGSLTPDNWIRLGPAYRRVCP